MDENSFNKYIVKIIAAQGGRASMGYILGQLFPADTGIRFTNSNYLWRMKFDSVGINYELTAKGWALAKRDRDLEQGRENRLAALERLSPRERRSLMQADFS